ncbi:hypothetical protein [Thiocapsa sp.]|uniref:hypothetical protein n=1 Tax=Thiocapsa sp. TaxID=2024551 RepID=UPI0025E3F37B|nr:hypothetical protein [Thiocapsa sp.]
MAATDGTAIGDPRAVPERFGEDMRAMDLGAPKPPPEAGLGDPDGYGARRWAAVCRRYSVIHSHCFTSTKSFD